MSEGNELALRLVKGAVLEGEDAMAVLETMGDAAPWPLWVQIAIAYLKLGEAGRALYVLEHLMANYGRGVESE